jgi:hypothetical protein
LYQRYLPPFRHSASHTLSLSLCLSISYLSFPTLPSHTSHTHGKLFCLSLIAIKSLDKHCCFTQRAEHNKIFAHLATLRLTRTTGSKFTNPSLTLTTCSLYYKQITIVNDDSSIVNKFEASLTDGYRVIIYYHHMLIVQATSCKARLMSWLPPQYFFRVHFVGPTNIRLACKGLLGTNTLPYYENP